MKTVLKKYAAPILLAAMTLSAVIIIIAVSASRDRRRAEMKAELPPAAVTESAVTELSEIGYWLREYGGRLAVFRGDSTQPFKKLNVGTSLMTEEDRRLLQKGIFAGSESELKRLIEDYTS